MYRCFFQHLIFLWLWFSFINYIGVMYADHICFCSLIWSWCMERSRFRDRDDIRTSVHSVCHSPGPKEGKLGDNCTNCNWFHCRSQHLGGRGVWWSFNEPSSVIRASFGKLELGQPLGLLGRATHRWWASWHRLRVLLH